MKNWFAIVLLGITCSAFAQGKYEGKFEQLGPDLPTPNEYRSASGAPGHAYWQQQVDYHIALELDDENQTVTGSEQITYINNSPNPLTFLWVQLDQNMRAPGSNTPLIESSRVIDSLPAKYFDKLVMNDDYGASDFTGGFNIDAVKDHKGEALQYMINKTMMKVTLSQPLPSGGNITFGIDWHYNINDRMMDGGRSGYEYFPEDDNYLYTIAQFYPRMAVYDDVNGWQNKQFLGRGEFALEFGDYEVEITVPSDHIVSATGVLQNPGDVLTKTQEERFKKAQETFDKPVLIVTEEEAIENEKTKASDKKTWVFKADNVRDFAFASSRKFIWDAMAVQLENSVPLAMSFYPKEGNPLWEEHSTLAVKNTLVHYSEHTFDYPYPVAISIHTASIGMEYPMICFNYGRPNPDGTYSESKKWGMIGVIIHEVGHNFFPMIVNSDERQWTWMDEGLNSFLQALTEQKYYPTKPLRRGPPSTMIDYMKLGPERSRPIMTNSEQILHFGDNAYGKPATALWVLRHTVMGPELFDSAFKEYAQRWAFKRPMPADFFRSMEDASAVDLDWFWKGWFYTTDNVDVAVSDVKWFRLKNVEEGVEKNIKAKKGDIGETNNGTENSNNKEMPTTYEEVTVLDTDERYYTEFKNRLDDSAIRKKYEDKNLYEVSFQNKGGLVTPLIVEFNYADGSKKVEKIPAEIWRKNENEVKKVFATDKEVVKITLDPYQETADINMQDNFFPRKEASSRFDQFKQNSAQE